MTDGAAAVIPEVLAGQILSLARRGRGGHTVLAANSGAGEGGRDRLVVLLQPILAERDAECDAKRDAEGADERPRHALVISCAPGQVRIFLLFLFFLFFFFCCCPSCCWYLLESYHSI